ncbi:Cytochrome c oxidase subunit 7C, mitochondrial [Bulinus truncatus]|nr:Cytochrome c oxidase subunit 7C, mitochondrial [Bulinus truncatus]
MLCSSTRKFSASSVRQHQVWQQEGIPGSSLPFDTKNKFKLTAVFILYFSSGLTMPFLLVRHYLLKISTPLNVPMKQTTIRPVYMDESDIQDKITI